MPMIPSSWKAESGGSQLQDQLSEILSQNIKQKGLRVISQCTGLVFNLQYKKTTTKLTFVFFHIIQMILAQNVQG